MKVEFKYGDLCNLSKWNKEEKLPIPIEIVVTMQSRDLDGNVISEDRSANYITEVPEEVYTSIGGGDFLIPLYIRGVSDVGTICLSSKGVSSLMDMGTSAPIHRDIHAIDNSIEGNNIALVPGREAFIGEGALIAFHNSNLRNFGYVLKSYILPCISSVPKDLLCQYNTSEELLYAVRELHPDFSEGEECTLLLYKYPVHIKA